MAAALRAVRFAQARFARERHLFLCLRDTRGQRCLERALSSGVVSDRKVKGAKTRISAQHFI